MNKIILLGRLTREPEVKTTPTGKTVVVFSLAVDRPYKGRDGKTEADFINIVAWNKTAELWERWAETLRDGSYCGPGGIHREEKWQRSSNGSTKDGCWAHGKLRF